VAANMPSSSPHSVLRTARLRRSLPLTEVAVAVSASPSFLSQVERGRRRGSLDLLSRLAKLYGLSLDLVLLSAAVLPAWFLAKVREAPAAALRAAQDGFGKYR
jgi:transcriptional regulator with XRE-family HTH domain